MFLSVPKIVNKSLCGWSLQLLGSKEIRFYLLTDSVNAAILGSDNKVEQLSPSIGHFEFFDLTLWFWPSTWPIMDEHFSTSFFWQFQQLQWRIYGGRKGPPGGPNSFNFMQFSGKCGKIVCWCPLGSWRPLLREILDQPLNYAIHVDQNWKIAQENILVIR